ncbi:hypothetical protein KR032_011856 [Drosophila birchii]|nr:hypothetical protein KR032_011856 [Drosophila birchii]
MTWIRPVQLLLAAILIVQCRTGKLCNGKMWFEPKVVFNGEPFEVFCRCNGSQVNLQNLTFKDTYVKENWDTTTFDNYTVMHRENSTCGRKAYRVYCRHGDEVLSEIIIKVVPILHFKNYTCFANEKEVSCSFDEFDFAASFSEKTYTLSIDGGPSIPCSKGDQPNWIHCNGSYTFKNSICAPNPKIVLTLKSGDVTQSQEFPLTESPPPVWPHTPPEFFEAGPEVCWNWTHTNNVTHLTLKQNWKVEIRPENPKIDKIRYEISVDPANYTICIPNFPYAYQFYIFWFERRYNTTNAHWSTIFKTTKYRNNATVSARSPDFIPTGYFHDPKENELTVYWHQLDELEFNGPNFKYKAASSIGPKPSSSDNNSAIFKGWDSTRSANIYVWCENSVGVTMSNKLEIPVLKNENVHRPLNAKYHEHNKTMTWEPPEDQVDLDGYVISWCESSSPKKCDNSHYIQFVVVAGWECQYVFSRSMSAYNLGVSARYQSESSGGLCWLYRSFIRDDVLSDSSLDLSQDIGAVVVVIGIIIYSLLHQPRI